MSPRAAPLLLALLLSSCAGAPAPKPAPVPLKDLEAWVIQLNGIERAGAVDRLSRADADLVVIDRVSSVKDRAGYPLPAVVTQIRASAGRVRERKLCLAYLNVGEAEEFRSYWGADWRPPGHEAGPNPPYLLAEDPEGWTGDYPVAYWEPDWEAILDAEVAGAVADGFDGVMLDWVAGYADDRVKAAATAAGVDPAAAMAKLVRRISARARRARPGFVILLNGGAGLVAAHLDLVTCVDGVVAESLWFGGGASSSFEEPGNADRPVPAEETETRLATLKAVRAAGLAVFVLDYASRPEARGQVIDRSRRLGFVPSVSRTSLDRLPDEAVRR